VAAADEELCVLLACPDAPMVQIGGFHFGQCLTDVPRAAPCLLLGWPLNNYWDTNFPASQPGFKSIRYELTSARSFDPAAAMRFGLSAATPVEYHPVLSRNSVTEGPLFELDNRNVQLTALRRTMDGENFIVHLTNPTDTTQSVRMKLPVPWQRAFMSNSLEERLTPVAGGGQNARSTVVRAFCPPPSITKPCAGQTVFDEAPVLQVSLEPRNHALVRLEI